MSDWCRNICVAVQRKQNSSFATVLFLLLTSTDVKKLPNTALMILEQLCNHRGHILLLCTLSEQTRLMKVLRGRTGWTAGKQTGREGGGVRWRDFLLCGSLTLTMEPRSATQIALSPIVSLALYLPRRLPLSHSFSSSHPVTPLARSESNLLDVAPPHLCWSSPPLLPHVCSFSRQAGLKSQLRIEPSRLKPVSPTLPTPNLWLAGYSGKTDEEQVTLLRAVPHFQPNAKWLYSHII